MSGCNNNFFGCAKKEVTANAENKPLAQNAVEEASTVVASTEVAIDEAVEAAATEQATESTVVAEATMPMNEVAAEQKIA
jgi:hypothetical protein